VRPRPLQFLVAMRVQHIRSLVIVTQSSCETGSQAFVLVACLSGSSSYVDALVVSLNAFAQASVGGFPICPRRLLPLLEVDSFPKS
jgi:hypothetical protein